MSVDGLITGMSTTDTVAQLMQVEALPQTALKTKVGLQNSVVTAYQSINSRMSSLVTAAKALGSADTWGALKATSNSDAAVVTANAGAAAGSLTFRVANLAAAHTMTFPPESAVASATDAVMSGSTFDITVPDGMTTKVLQLTPKDMSLQSVVAAINGATESPYKAAAVQIGPGRFTLQLTAKDGGTAGAAAFAALGTPSGLDLGTPTVTFQGEDAKLVVGAGVGAYEITSKTNTFADLLPGVTVTAARKQADGDAGVTINLVADPDGVAGKVQALVDNANVALSELAAQTRTKSGSTPAGALVGDSAMRKLSQEILSAVSGGAGSLGSLNSVGVGLDRGGRLTFDKTKFTEAYTADPAKTQAYFDSYTEVPHVKASATQFTPGWDQAQGLARKLETFALQASVGVTLPTDLATTPRQGVLQGLIQRRTETIKNLNDQVSAWDVRLDLRKTALQKQFSSLEVALGKMKQQSSWLAGQLAGLS